MGTRIIGAAGPLIDLVKYLDAELGEICKKLNIAPSQWTYGALAKQVEVIYADTITLAQPNGGGETVTLDLFSSEAPELLDIFNRALTMTALKFLYIKNNSADATLKVLGTATTAIPICADPLDIIKIPPGGDAILWNDPSAAGLLISTNKDLKIEHDGTGEATMDVDIVAMGLD